MNKAIILIDLMMQELGVKNYYELANYFGITAASLTGWITRNSVNAAIKHAHKKKMDVDKLLKKMDEIIESVNKKSSLLDNNIKRAAEVIEFSKNFSFSEKEKFFFACEKFKITHEDIAAAAKISTEEVEKIKNESIPTRIFSDYDEFLSKCFFEKYNEFMKKNVATTEPRRTKFAETYLTPIQFAAKPHLFWLIYICIGFFVLNKKIEAENVENFLDILIQNRDHFGDNLSLINNTEELIDTVLTKIEELLPKPKIDPVEEFIKLS